MCRLPLQFPSGESVESLGLTGREVFDLAPLEEGARTLHVKADGIDGDSFVLMEMSVAVPPTTRSKATTRKTRSMAGWASTN